MREWEVDFDYDGLWVSALVKQDEVEDEIEDLRVYVGDTEITRLISKAGFMELSSEVLRRYDDQRIEALR